jgi:plastocyanin
MHIRSSALVLAFTLLMGACGGDGGGGTTQPPTTGSITGQVSTSSGAVSGAGIALSPGGGTQTTNASGQFSFSNLEPRSYTLTLQQLPQGFALGSENATKSVNVTAGGSSTVSWTVQPPTGQPPAGPTVEVIGASSFQFERPNITIARGTTVRWINRENIFHDVVAENNAFPSGNIPNQGSTHEVVFNTAGTFRYRCTPHSSNFTNGMVGVVTVQ